MDYTELVRELNTELYERFGEVEKVFEYSTTGFVDAISFGGVLLWNSEMEVREWIEEKNDYEPFFLRMTKEGNCNEINVKDSSYGFKDEDIDVGFDIHKNMYISIFAKDETHAIKIANEKRVQLIAENRWK